MTATAYAAPGWFTRHVFNPIISALSRMGISVWGARNLAVRGRSSGEWRVVPVNLLEHDGRSYLVAPRGTTQWVRNLRAAGGGELRLGRRTEAFSSVEIAGDEKDAALRAYLVRWQAEVGAFFDGVNRDSPDSEFARIAADHPVFRVTR